MKLIDQFTSLSDANEICSKLRNAGILAYVSSAQSYMLSRVKTGALKVGLWIILDDQFEDAKELLRNPKYKPKVVLTEQEMIDLEIEAKQAKIASSKMLFEKAAAWFFGSIICGLIAFVVYGVINEV